MTEWNVLMLAVIEATCLPTNEPRFGLTELFQINDLHQPKPAPPEKTAKLAGAPCCHSVELTCQCGGLGWRWVLNVER
jgi:hypothetical protein